MICPGNPEHRGVRVIKMDKRIVGNDFPHYAKAICAVKGCGIWIKWLSRKEAERLEGVQEQLESDTGMGMREEGAGFSDKELNQIREIVREEIKRLEECYD